MEKLTLHSLDTQTTAFNMVIDLPCPGWTVLFHSCWSICGSCAGVCPWRSADLQLFQSFPQKSGGWTAVDRINSKLGFNKIVFYYPLLGDIKILSQLFKKQPTSLLMEEPFYLLDEFVKRSQKSAHYCQTTFITFIALLIELMALSKYTV